MARWEHNGHWHNIASDHPVACKRGIFAGQVNRFLCNNSEPAGFDRDVSELKSYLNKRGYPDAMSKVPHYDHSKRMKLLYKLHSRDVRAAANTSDACVLVMPYSSKVISLGLLNRLRGLFKTLNLTAKPVVAFSMRGSMFLRTYRLNTPVDLRGVPG